MIQHSSHKPASLIGRPGHWLWMGPLLYMVFVGLYFVGRYGGYWSENDSAVFAKFIRIFADEGRLIPEHGDLYANGYAFSAISTFILAFTGLEVATLQQIVYPLLAALVVIPAWLLYRELSGSARGAALSTVLLFLQPEFLFVILRSSHEKFTRTFMLLCLYFLVRSFKLRDQPRAFALHVGLFYLLAFALATSNNLLANSFFFALTLAMLLGWVQMQIGHWLLRRKHADQWYRSALVLQRLLYATLICMGLVYVVTFAIYPPAQHDLSVLKGIGHDSAALLRDDREAGNAYAVVNAGWISLPVYFLVSIANWIILGTSFLVWCSQGLRWLWNGTGLKTPGVWLAWLFYAAFALQGALSVIADASGGLGSNLQHRLFPSIAMIGVALVGTALAEWRPRRFTQPIRFVLAISIAGIAMLSIFKVTNDPAVSNMWMFYRPYEPVALEWSDAHLEDAEIWTEFNERVTVALLMQGYESTNRNRFIAFQVYPTTRSMLVSTVTRLRSSRLHVPLPVPPDALRVYDNGDAQIYRLRPRTPHQH